MDLIVFEKIDQSSSPSSPPLVPSTAALLLPALLKKFVNELRLPGSGLFSLWNEQFLLSCLCVKQFNETPRIAIHRQLKDLGCGLNKTASGTVRIASILFSNTHYASTSFLKDKFNPLLIGSKNLGEISSEKIAQSKNQCADALGFKNSVDSLYLRLCLQSTSNILPELNHFMLWLIEFSAREEKPHRPLTFALMELIRNAMEHGNQNDETKNVWLECLLMPRQLGFSIRDEGPGFDLTSVPDPLTNPTSTLAERRAKGLRPGGFGIAMTRKIADTLRYNTTGNQVWLSKNW